MAVSRTSKTMLNSGGESGHPSFISDFRGNPLKIFAIEGNTCCVFVA